MALRKRAALREGRAPAPFEISDPWGWNCRQARRPAKSASPSDLFQAPGQPSTPAREGAEDKMKIRLLLFFVLPAVLLGIGISVHAQNNSSDAHLSGTLLDSSGAGVPNVRVTAQAEGDKNAQLWKATSTTDGAYSLSLPPGRYHVSFEGSPFVSRDFVIDLSANQQRQLDLHLELEPLNSNVVVTAQAEPTLAEQTTAPVSVITKEEIEERQSVGLADALAFTPGIAIGRTGPEGGSASVFLNGGNSNFTKILVDGAPINPPGAAVDFSSL